MSDSSPYQWNEGTPNQAQPWDQQPGTYPAPGSAPAGPAGRTGKPVLGVLAGVVAALVGAIVWAVIGVATGHEIGWIALAVGALVGLSMGAVGGTNRALPVIGAVLAVAGCGLGRFFELVKEVADYYSMSIGETLNTMFSQLDVTWDAYTSTFEAIDLLFVAIAAFEGYVFTQRFAARHHGQ